MTQEERQLVLKDLCARLPHGVKMNGKLPNNLGRDTLDFVLTPTLLQSAIACGCKPYLREISDMTLEECDRLFQILSINEDNPKEWLKINDAGIIRLFTEEGKDFDEIADAIDYLCSIHVDFRGFINRGLALPTSVGVYDLPSS